MKRPLTLSLTAGLLGLALTAVAAPAHAATQPRPAAVAYDNHGCTYYYGTALTVRGNTGNRVRQVQCILVKMAWLDPGDVDGIFGPVTEGAVKKFQTDVGLDPDGEVGVNTWAALRS